MNRITEVVLGLALTATLAAPNALADKGHHGHHGNSACKEDMKKFCKGKHGADKKACVEANKAQFSQGCQEAMAKHEKHEDHEHHEGTDHSEQH
ncbi:MAG: hypothetical protein ACKN9V_01975 [Pseudomonadota bacterium]